MATVNPSEKNRLVKESAAQLGFKLCGITPAKPVGHVEYLRDWLVKGYAGTMDYLAYHLEKRIDPGSLLKGARSVVMVGLQYYQPPPPGPKTDTTRGQIAMYAWGGDYHDVLKEKLFKMAELLREQVSEPFRVKVCVDTAPLLEREVAAAAGLGWIGKNTLVLNQKLGSYFFLGAMITTLEIAPDEPATDHCGTCSACMDACPTDAFIGPYQMDASRCISYLTIEHRGAISDEFSTLMGDWIFGCDVCQQVCPFNRDAPITQEPRFSPRGLGSGAAVEDILSWTEDEYREQLRGSAIKRAKLDMLKRNAGIVRDNHRTVDP